ncbi:MAG: leucine-rich repeat protein [Clostridia bacterium]|nr:leucine-rich repeat protein [Clostridia bacterium]
MKKIVLALVLLLCISMPVVCANAEANMASAENVTFTLENGVLTVHETAGFEGELILPTAEMGAVNKIVMEETSGSDGVTALKLTATDEIVIEKNAFFGNENIKELELNAGNTVKLCGEGWNWDDRWNFGCFEASSLEKVIIRTKELDMSEGWAFHECSALCDFEATAEAYQIGENCFTDYYWNGTKRVLWIPWVENQKEDFVYLGDNIIAYIGASDIVTIPNGKLTIDTFTADGYYYDIKKIIMSDGINEIPSTNLYSAFTFLGSLEQIALSRNLAKIPSGCFRLNKELKDVWISKATEEIGGQVFPENCSATIHYEGTEEEWNNIALLSESADVNEALYQKYLATLTNMKLHFNCTNSELKESKITNINVIDDYPYTIEVHVQGEVNQGVLVVALMKEGHLVTATTHAADGYFKLPVGMVGDKIKVFWFDSIENLIPLCEAFEYSLPQNSVVATYNEYKEIYPDFFNSLLKEKVTDELLTEWLDHTCDLLLEEITANKKELSTESFEEALPQAMFSSLITKRKFVGIRSALIDLYPDAIYDLVENGVVHEAFYPWAEAVKALAFNN